MNHDISEKESYRATCENSLEVSILQNMDYDFRRESKEHGSDDCAREFAVKEQVSRSGRQEERERSAREDAALQTPPLLLNLSRETYGGK